MSPTQSKPNDELIRDHAYHLWEQDGRPHGRDVEYWEKARALVENGARPAKAAKLANGHAVDKPVARAAAKPAPVKAKAAVEAPEASKRRTAVAKADPPKAKAAPAKAKPKK